MGNLLSRVEFTIEAAFILLCCVSQLSCQKNMPATDQQSEEFQKFLDQNQYSSNSILRYEKIFGRGFVSTGGLETSQVRIYSFQSE